MKNIDLKSLILAIVIVSAALLLLAVTRKPRPADNPAITPTAQKAAKSIRDARDW